DDMKTAVQKLMLEHNGVAVFLPPYAYDAMPIEHMWGMGKSGVAAEYSSDGRSLEQVTRIYRETLYGRYKLHPIKQGGRLKPNELASRMVMNGYKGLLSIMEKRHPELAKRGLVTE